jgi:hypothetical protein
MVHYDDTRVRDLVAQAKPVLKGLPSEYDDFFDEGQEHLKVLEAFGDLDSGLPENSKTEGWRSQRDASAAWLEALFEQLPEQGAPVGPATTTHMYIDPRGRHTTDRLDDSGNVVDREQMTREETEDAEAVIRLRVDEREAAREDLREAGELRRLVAATTDTVAAGQLRERANALQQQAEARLDKLRKAIVAEAESRGLSEQDVAVEVRSYDLVAPEPYLPGVEAALESLHSGRTDAAAEAVRVLGPEARYQLLRRLPPEDQKWFDLLLETTPEEDAELARAAGRGA